MDAEKADIVAAKLLGNRPPTMIGAGQTQTIRTSDGDEDRTSHVVLAGSLDEDTECLPALLSSEFLGHIVDEARSQKVTSGVADQDQQYPTLSISLGHQEVEEVSDAVGTIDRLFVPVLGQLLKIHAIRMA